MDVEIPAKIFLPPANADNINDSEKKLSNVKGLEIKDVKNGYVEMNAGSGEYQFTVQQ